MRYSTSKLAPLMTAVIALTASASAVAQAGRCTIPPSLESPRAEYAPPGSAQILPLTGFVLALSWSPQFCKSRGGEAKFASQCGNGAKFGFILHGLWPDAEGQSEPRWCRRVPILSKELVRRNFCATPSPQLQQREWAKHGSCITSDPERYFTSARQLFSSINSPDMNALSRSNIDVAGFTSAFVALNPGLRNNMIRVSLSDTGWLEEVRICLGTDYQPRPCPRDIGGTGAGARLRIWRAER